MLNLLWAMYLNGVLHMPKTYIIETAESISTVYAMDWQDAVETWGGQGSDILCIKEYENPQLGVDTIH